MKNGTKALCLFLFLVGTWSGCSPQVAGGTSETTSGSMATGTVVLADGITPAAGASVYLRPANFVADTGSVDQARQADAITDAQGKFTIDSVQPGSWTVEINDQDQAVEMISLLESHFTRPTIALGPIALRTASTLQGHIDRSGLAPGEAAYVQIYGLDRVQRADSNGNFEFKGLPSGNLVLRLHSSDAGHGVIPGDSVALNVAEKRDAGVYRLPVDFWRDTLAIRAILDSNGLTQMPISSVSKRPNPQARIDELNLTRLGITIIPNEFFQLRLKHLRLDNNLLDSLPSEIGTMVSLNDISAIGNKFSVLPESICKLIHLGHFNVSNNNLTTLPDNITNLSNLNYLNVDGNLLTNLPDPLKAWLDRYSTNSAWLAAQRP